MAIRLRKFPNQWLLKSVNPRNYRVSLINTYEDESEAMDALIEAYNNNSDFHYVLEGSYFWSATSE